MPKRKFSVEQIVGVLKQAEFRSGADPQDRITEQTFYRWKAKYSGLEVDQVRQNHHGNRDSTNGAILRALRPRVIIQQNWLSAQPGEEVVIRMASSEY